MKSAIKVTIGFAAMAAVGATLWWIHRQTTPEQMPVRLQDPRSHEAQAAEKERKQGDLLYAQGKWKEAEGFYRGFIARHAPEKDADVQDEVGAARIRLGYLTRKTDGYEKARAVFKEAVAEYKGTGRMGADFGGPQDQAAYQAIVCLEASGKKEEARAEYIDFLKKQQKSPLATAAYKRLVRLNGGKATAEYDKLLQDALDAQDKWVRAETATCGPKCIDYLLKASGKSSPGYKTLAETCGTTEKGTTLEGMRKCLKANGLGVYGFVVNRRDFADLPLPAIWLLQDHYVVLLRFSGRFAVVYDPVMGAERPLELPALDDTRFEGTVLTFQAPHLRVRS